MTADPSLMRGRPVFWFRRDLRLHDNAGLAAALRAHDGVVPVFTWDPGILDGLDRDNPRVTFIHDVIAEIQAKLVEHGSSLLVLEGEPQNLFEQHPPSSLWYNHDYEPAALARDAAVGSAVERAGGEVRSFKDHAIFERDDVVKDDGSPLTVYTPYARRWKARLGPGNLAAHPSEEMLDRLWRSEPLALPSLDDLRFRRSTVPVPERLPGEHHVKQYHRTRDRLDLDDGTTRLGPHLRFGTTSIREAMRLAEDANRTLMDELIWREFFISILWHFPHVTEGAFREEYNAIRWENDEGLFDAWREGRTGYPVVDAGMRELAETGYMHNRARMITASFLCKDLLIDWRWGERHFQRLLLDHELASNNGGWQWAAGTGCDAAPYFRVFNPSLQERKFDPDGAYVRRWVPEVGTDGYPKPIVDHKERRLQAIAMYKEALGR